MRKSQSATKYWEHGDKQAVLKNTKCEQFFAWLSTKGDGTDAHGLVFPQRERSSIVSYVVPE